MRRPPRATARLRDDDARQDQRAAQHLHRLQPRAEDDRRGHDRPHWLDRGREGRLRGADPLGARVERLDRDEPGGDPDGQDPGPRLCEWLTVIGTTQAR